jgi:hypothetical protein
MAGLKFPSIKAATDRTVPQAFDVCDDRVDRPVAELSHLEFWQP